MNFELREDGYYVPDENGETVGVINWEYNEEGDMVITHTIVSDKLRGMGAGMKLLNKAVEYAKENNLKIVPVCSFAVKRITEIEGAEALLR
ncbi:MAG: GNAT family N-acetyltransferase [Ndongobacter sp.]|nr:GNAT family N-acetyltransferase [Ndongobacter sp.]